MCSRGNYLFDEFTRPINIACIYVFLFLCLHLLIKQEQLYLSLGGTEVHVFIFYIAISVLIDHRHLAVRCDALTPSLGHNLQTLPFFL